MDDIMKLVSSYAIYVCIFSFILALIFKGLRFYGILGLISLLVGIILNIIIANIFYRDRPFVTYDNVHLLLEKGVSASFPSDQATIAFVWAFALCFYSSRTGIISFFIALLVGISRIYVGHHYPFDILGGIIIAFISTYLTKSILTKSSVIEKTAQHSS